VFAGYVGKGLLDAAAVGQVFASPAAEQMQAAMRHANGGAGVLRLYGNYGGDVMNFDMAGEMLEMEDIASTTVLLADDVASAPPAEAAKRRGVAGMVFAFKAAGARAEERGNLAEVTAAAQKTADACRSIGFALTPCIVPQAGKPTFTLADDEMEMGVGIHGEPGRRREKLAGANEIIDELVEAVVSDLPYDKGDDVALMINGLGGTPISELYLLYGRAHDQLAGRGLNVGRSYVGEYCTSLDMAGCSVTLVRLDEEITSLLAEPAEIAIRTF